MCFRLTFCPDNLFHPLIHQNNPADTEDWLTNQRNDFDFCPNASLSPLSRPPSTSHVSFWQEELDDKPFQWSDCVEIDNLLKEHEFNQDPEVSENMNDCSWVNFPVTTATPDDLVSLGDMSLLGSGLDIKKQQQILPHHITSEDQTHLDIQYLQLNRECKLRKQYLELEKLEAESKLELKESNNAVKILELEYETLCIQRKATKTTTGERDGFTEKGVS